MREYPDNHRRLLDGGDDLELAATLRAVFEVDIEHAFEQARPAHARRCMCVLLGVIAWFLRWARHDRRTQPGMGCQHPVKTDQVQAWARHQRGQADNLLDILGGAFYCSCAYLLTQQGRAIQMTVLQKRQDERFNLRCKVKLRIFEEDDDENEEFIVDGTTTSIGQGGIFFATKTMLLRESARVIIELEMPDGGAPLTVNGCVTRSFKLPNANVDEYDPGMGIKFTNISEIDVARIAKLALELNH